MVMEACEIVQQIGRDAKVSMYIECDHKMYSGGKPGRKEFMDFFFPLQFLSSKYFEPERAYPNKTFLQDTMGSPVAQW